MSLRSDIETLFVKHVFDFISGADFQALESGRASRAEYLRFVENVVRTHLKSPQRLAFLFALAPPEVADDLAHNLLEELGMEADSDIVHPSRLKQLAVGAGLAPRLPELEASAASDLRQLSVDPLRYGSLKEAGLAALCEITASEFMFAGVAGRIARALATHCGLSPTTLEWFTHHSEVDIQHAERGLDNLGAYIRYYQFSEADALTIIEMTLRENGFSKCSFGARPHSCVTAEVA